MGKKAKIGKKRKDKFYHLAKETGYRARSAFKLIQLNRKYGFLQESRVLIDLCAAPGGWLQVAANFMPMSSIILGVDLVSIKPIKNVTTFQADITTDHCRQALKKELKNWKTDVVLNDGAPNVGSAWVQDAFTQAQLALSALKLASEFLRKGGWFVTKVFRSKDYTALLWVFQQLFKKVHSTKPQASRSESAEIFVVCQGYLAPDKLDEKFLDPKHVFKEIENNSKVTLNILRPEKQVRHRDGYDDSNPTMFETVTDEQFIESNNAIQILSTVNKVSIVTEKILNHKATTEEIKKCCEDIKVLGRGELKALFTWRKKVRKSFKLDDDIEDDNKTPEDVQESEKTEEEKQEELDKMVNDVREEEMKELKRKNKKVREHKKKLRERLAGKLADASGDHSTQEQDLFELNLMKNKKELDEVEDADMDDVDDQGDDLQFESEASEEESEEDEEDDDDEGEYVYGADELYEKPAKLRKLEHDHHTNVQQKEIQKSKLKKINRQSENPLLVDMATKDDAATSALNKAKQWYQKDIFQDVEKNDGGYDDNDDEDKESDDEYDIEQMLLAHKKKGGKIIEADTKSTNEADTTSTNEAGDDLGSDGDNDVDNESSDNRDNTLKDDDGDSDTDNDVYDIDDRSISEGKQTKNKETKKMNKKAGFEIAPVELGPEALALGGALATSKKRKRDIIDDSFNRYAFHDGNLPSWFIEDEAKHTIRHIPVTKEEVNFYKRRLMEINARPIKKVIEAKTKKKYKTIKNLERARKRAQGILDATDVSSQEKQQQIKGIYKKAGLLAKKRPETTYVVAKKGLAGKKYKRPSNVKGPYRVVDPRMKKDLRAMKSKEKTKGRSHKKGRKR